MIAKFSFSDRFTKIKSNDKSFSALINDENIAHSVDIEKRFKRNEAKTYWLDPTDQHLMVWY